MSRARNLYSTYFTNSNRSMGSGISEIVQTKVEVSLALRLKEGAFTFSDLMVMYVVLWIFFTTSMKLKIDGCGE